MPTLLAIFIDGIAVGEHVVVVALGVDSAGTKHPLGLWERTTENKAVCSGLLGNLIDRGSLLLGAVRHRRRQGHPLRD